jgi:hypothetical protein
MARKSYATTIKLSFEEAIRFLSSVLVSGKNPDGTDYTMPISAGLTLDPTNLATGAKQDTGNTSLGLIAPAASAAAVAPSDSVDLANAATKGIYVGVSGDVKIDLVTGGSGIVFKAAPVGLLRVQAKRVYATGTTATNMVALY